MSVLMKRISAPGITLVVSLLLLSGPMFAAESAGHKATLAEMFTLLSKVRGTAEKYEGSASLLLSKSSEADIEQFLSSLQSKPDEKASDVITGGSYRYVQAYYPGYFLVFTLGNETDKWNGVLYASHFTLRRHGPEVLPDETDVYQLLRSLHGPHSTTKLFTLRYRTKEKLMNYVWLLDDVVITYRAFYDSRKGDNLAVVRYWDRAFYESHNFKKY